VHRSGRWFGAVTTDGENLVSHAGTALLAEMADRTGLTLELSRAMADCGISWHTHDPGVVLTHLAVAIADGADCLSDMAVLRGQTELFGPVASNPTAWRAVKKTTSVELRRIPQAVAAARNRVHLHRREAGLHGRVDPVEHLREPVAPGDGRKNGPAAGSRRRC
jgi:hypothetical protein